MRRSNPYVGPRSFTRKEADRFFGREREARDLLSLVMSERLALFYAQSGAGKTSLLHTRLIPDLEEQGRAVLPVGRVSGGLPAQAEAVENIFVFSLLLRLEQGGANPAQLAHLSLSTFLRGLVSEDGATYRYEPSADEKENAAVDSDAPVCVLIIDQFEEILTQHLDRWQERAAFFRQLNQAMQDDPKLSVVLALREDYVAGLEPYAPLLAGRMRARFHMERMGRQAALAAVAGPAQQQGRPFAPGAAELLVDNLSLVRSGRDKAAKPGQHIEPVQLQVVCFQLWENVAAGECITAADVQAAGSIDRALADFYEQAVAEAVRSTGVSELLLRQWVDHKLITPAGTRGMVFQGETDAAGLDNRAVRLLEDRFLLRAESRAGAVWYELVHDRFVEPIMQANRAWLEAQGPLLRDAQAWIDSGKVNRSLLYTGEKLTKTLAEINDEAALEPVVREFLAGCKGRQAYLDEKAAANRRVRRLFKIAVAVAVVAVLASLWAGWATYKADTQLIEANYNFGLALNERAKAIEQSGSRLFAHLYSLCALDKMAQRKNKDAYQEAVIRAQSNTVPLPAFVGHSAQEIVSLAFSPDGHLLASASGNSVTLWNAATGDLLKRLEGHDGRVHGIAFSSDGRFIASASLDKTVRIWDISTGKYQNVRHEDRVYGIAFSPDGRFIASASLDKTVRIWDTATNKFIQQLKGHKESVYNVAFSPDGRLLVSASKDGKIGIWNFADGVPIQFLEGHKGEVNNVAFSPDGTTIASVSDDTKVGLWDATGRNLSFFEGHKEAVYAVAFSPDGRVLATGSGDKKVILWEVATGRRIKVLEWYGGKIWSVAFSPDGQTIAVGNKAVSLWEAAANGKRRILAGHKDIVFSVAFYPNGLIAASGSKDKTAGIWDVTTGKRIQSFAGYDEGVGAVTFYPKDKTLATASGNKIRLCDVTTGNFLRNLEGHKAWIASIAFSPHGHTIASGAEDGKTIFWDIERRKPIHIFDSQGAWVSGVAVSPDDRIVAAGLENAAYGSDGKPVVLWDITTGKRLWNLTGHNDSVYSVDFSPDGRTLTSGSADGTVGVWDVTAGKLIRFMKGHKDRVADVAFSPNGHTVASASWDDTIGLWDVDTGKCTQLFKGHGNDVLSVAFSPDGNTLISGSRDNTIGLWDLEDNPNEFSGISLAANGEYKIDLNTLPYKLEGLELKPIEQKNGPDQPARWSKYHPFHWLPQAEHGDSNAMLQLGIIYDRNNDLARALRWYGQAVKAGSKQAEEQQSRLLHWLEDKDNWQTVPGPFRDAFCKAKAEFALPEKVAARCGAQ